MVNGRGVGKNIRFFLPHSVVMFLSQWKALARSSCFVLPHFKTSSVIVTTSVTSTSPPHFTCQYRKHLCTNFSRRMATTATPTAPIVPTAASAATGSANNKFKFAACQLMVGEDKSANIENAKKAIDEAASNGANIIALPVCYISYLGVIYK